MVPSEKLKRINEIQYLISSRGSAQQFSSMLEALRAGKKQFRSDYYQIVVFPKYFSSLYSVEMDASYVLPLIRNISVLISFEQHIHLNRDLKTQNKCIRGWI